MALDGSSRKVSEKLSYRKILGLCPFCLQGMKLSDLDDSDRELLKKTRGLLRKRVSEISGVSAGLLTSGGSEFFGLCVDAKTSTVGMCAEYSAVGAMVTSGESRIKTIVAVTRKSPTRYGVLPPCGKCRDFIRGFGNPYVILQTGKSLEDLKKVRLSELVPNPWEDWASD
jgi:cytidine deaminase